MCILQQGLNSFVLETLSANVDDFLFILAYTLDKYDVSNAKLSKRLRNKLESLRSKHRDVQDPGRVKKSKNKKRS